jgi:hypothetical protein
MPACVHGFVANIAVSEICGRERTQSALPYFKEINDAEVTSSDVRSIDATGRVRRGGKRVRRIGATGAAGGRSAGRGTGSSACSGGYDETGVFR